MLSKHKVSQAHNKAIFLFSQYGHRYGYSRSRTTQPKEEHVDPFENVRIQKMQMMSFWCKDCEDMRQVSCRPCHHPNHQRTPMDTKDLSTFVHRSLGAEWKEMAGLVKFISQHGRAPANKNQHEPAWCMQVHAGPRMLPHVWDMLEKTLWRPQSLRVDCLTGQAFFLCHAKPHNQHSQHFLAAWS